MQAGQRVLSPAAAPDKAAYYRGLRRLVDKTAAALVFITVALSGVVYVEPAPYEFLVIGCFVVYLLIGVRVAPAVGPMVLLLVVFVMFGAVASLLANNVNEALFYTTVTAFLAATTIFFAVFVAEQPERRMRLVVTAYLVAAMVAAVAAIIGYMGVAPEILMLHGRARGTFQDPNVLGPFLVFPAIICLGRMLNARLVPAAVGATLLIVLTVAILLTFSRGAWGHLIISGLAAVFLNVALAPSPLARLRATALCLVGLAALAVTIMVALSIESIAELMQDRLTLAQSYDRGPEGRFGRHAAGFALAMEKPFGIGALEFDAIFTEAPHNVYLNVLMANGWFGALAYYILLAWTLMRGVKGLLVASPLRPFLIAAVATLAGLAIEGLIIDTDRWRHFYLLIGLIWGMTAHPVAHTARPRHPAFMAREVLRQA